MVKKNISREQIIETALALMQNKNDLRGLNLREVARTLGCAHTNLYNYFPAYSDLLWEIHAALQEIFMETLISRLNTTNTAEQRLFCFFASFVELYMDNKGWFRLAWHEYIEGERPQRDIEATDTTNKLLNKHISAIWKDIYGEYPDTGAAKRVLHNTHCYIVGEISNYLLGRGWIENEAEMKAIIIHEAVGIFTRCLSN